jgi:3'(2'), 5'-bisphosphate nucleotidase
MASPFETHERETTVALEAVRAAAALCQSVQSSLGDGVLEKDDRTPVTVADFGSQALICRALQNQFPQDPVIGEEDSSALTEGGNREVLDRVVERVGEHVPSANEETVCAWIDHGNADAYSDRFWTLDPIDGTKGFVRGDQYAIALALVVDGKPQVAALGCPNLPHDFDADDPTTGQVFLAVRGEGAVQMPVQPGADGPTRIGVSDVDTPSEGRFTESFVSSHSSHDHAVAAGNRLGIDVEPLRIDSQAKYAIVARGDAEIYFRLPRPGTDYTEKIWDHAAGSLVVEAAGGTVTDVHGEALDFTHAPLLSENVGIVASNGRFHPDVLDALDAVREETEA